MDHVTHTHVKHVTRGESAERHTCIHVYTSTKVKHASIYLRLDVYGARMSITRLDYQEIYRHLEHGHLLLFHKVAIR